MSQARISVVHATTLSLVQERSRSVSLGLPPSPSTNKQIERNLQTLVDSASELTNDLEDKNRLAKAGRIGLEEVRLAEDAVAEVKSNLENLLNLLGTDEWAMGLRQQTKDSCSLLQPTPQQASKEEEPSAYAAAASDRKHYHDEEEEDGAASTALMQSQKHQLQEQDEQLDFLGASISRQHHLSLQMNEELEQQGDLLGELDEGVDGTALRLGSASNQLERVRRATRDHASSCTIIGLIVLLVTLIAVFK